MGRPKKDKNVKCSVEGCNDKCYKFRNGLSYCMRHYQQLLKNGKITVIRNPRDLNEIIIDNNIAYICLYNLKGDIIAKAIIDIDMVDICRPYKWVIDKNGYIISTTTKKTIFLHRLLCGMYDNNEENDFFNVKYIVKHRNLNKFDNRKENLTKIRIMK